MIRHLLRASVALSLFAAPALAQRVSIQTAGGSSAVAMGGDVTGQSSAATVSQVNGATPGGNCPAGQTPNGITNQAKPTGCFAPGGTGFGWGSYVSGSWSGPMPLGAPSQNTLSSNTIYCAPAIMISSMTIAQIGTRVVTVPSSGGTNLSLIYYSDTASHRPGAPLAYVNLSSASAVAVSAAPTSTPTLSPATRYWQCAWADGNVTIPGQLQGGVIPALFGIDTTSSGLTNWPSTTSNGLNGYKFAQTWSATPPDLSSTAVSSWTTNLVTTVVVPFLPQ